MLNCIHSALLRGLSWFWQGFARISPLHIGFLFLWMLRIINIQKKKKKGNSEYSGFYPWITTVLTYCRFCINIEKKWIIKCSIINIGTFQLCMSNTVLCFLLTTDHSQHTKLHRLPPLPLTAFQAVSTAVFFCNSNSIGMNAISLPCQCETKTLLGTGCL